MSQYPEMFIPLNMNYDKILLYRCIKETFNKINLWKKTSNYRKPKHYWLEIKGHEVGEHIIVKKTLRMIQDCVNPNLVAFHQLPAGMSDAETYRYFNFWKEKLKKISFNFTSYRTLSWHKILFKKWRHYNKTF